MTTPLRQFILKRGNTTVSSTYTGPSGEITYDTGLNAIRIHDGITPGGNLMPSGTLITVFQSNISALEANDAVQGGQIQVLQNLASSSGPTPPTNAATGSLWYDNISGRLYVNYDGFWVDASPENVYTLPVASDTVLGGVRIGDNLSIDGDGVLTALPQVTLGNLTVDDQTISGTRANADIILDPNGTGFVSVPKLRIPVGTLVQGTANIAVTIANLTLNTLLDYSTSSSDNLVAGNYDLPNGISGAGTGWAVYEFTTNPAPVLEIGDHIAGVGVPFLSNVLHIGTGPNANVVITDQTITSAPPVNGAQIYTTRDVVNAGLNISTEADTDISLIPGTGGHIITTADIIPFANDVYNLGTPSRRFKQLWLGGGTIFILDETLGTDQAIGARDGNIYIAGGTGLTVGKFTLTGNTIALDNPAEDFRIGTQIATGNLIINRPLQVNSPDNDAAFSVSRTGLTTVHAPVALTNTQAVFSIIGSSSRTVQPRNFANTMIQITGQDNVPNRISFDAFGVTGSQNAYTVIAARAARGSVDTPAATQAGDTILRFTGQGWTGSGAYAGSIIRLNLEAAETFNTSSATGTRLTIQTTPVGSSTIATTASFYSNGMVLGTNTGVTYADGTRQTTAWLGTTSLDGVNANVTAANVQIATLFSNASTQSTDIATLFSNAAAQQTQIGNLFSNAVAQQSDISALTANAAAQAVQINSIATNAVNVVTAGTGVRVSRTNGTVGIDATGVQTVTGTPNQILVANVANNITLSLPQNINTNSTVTFGNITVTGNINVEGNIISSENVSIESKILYLANSATAGSQLDGGGIVLGNINAAFARTFLYDYNQDHWDTDGAGLTTMSLQAADATVTGNIFSNGSAHFGGDAMVVNYNNAEVQIDSNRNDFSQLMHQNHNSGTNASTDFVATNDTGDDTSHFIDLGINSSTYNNPAYSITGPNDGYLFIMDGNLAIGTATAGNVIKFHTSGTTESNLRVTIDDNGLQSVGNVSATYFVGSGKYLTDLYSNADVAAYLTTDSNIIAIWANITSTNSAWQANAGTQQTEINALTANITAANSAIVTANSAVVGYVNSLNNAMTANITAVNLQIASTSVAVFANAASQQLEINALRANITAANSAVSALQSNTGVLANNINILFANAQAQEGSISALRANIAVANVNISSVSGSIITINSNVAAANAAIVSLQTAGYATVAQLTANVNAANSAIITANTGMKSYVDAQIVSATGYGNTYVEAYLPISSYIQGMNANVTAANAAIVTANTGMKSYVDTVTTNWTANAGTQQTEINALRANITAANSAIVTANSAVVSYVNSLNSNMIANVTAANSAIITANTGMKSYVDAQFSSGVTSLTGGNNIVLSGSTGGVTIQRVDGIQSVITGNTASSYTLTTTNQYFGTTRSATGTGTVTLPLGSTVPVGRQYIIKDEGGNSGQGSRRITITASGSDTIDGSATRGITSNYGSIIVLWTGTRWSVI